MVAYKSGSNGIVIRGTDLTSTMTFNDATSLNQTITEASGGFYVSDLSTKTTKTWVCPTKNQFQQMAHGYSGTIPYGTPVTGGLKKTTLESAGCTALADGSQRRYWTKTKEDGWCMYYQYIVSSNYLLLSGTDTATFYVRPIFTF